MRTHPSPDVPVVGALELGGGHVSGALVDADRLQIVEGSRRSRPLAPDMSGDGVIATLAAVGDGIARRYGVAPRGGVMSWALAVPGPFDYSRGIALFEGVGKFAALHGVDIRARLAEQLGAPPQDVRFTNDADAFVLGSWAAGSVRGHSRCMALTLGTGVGCSFAVDGRLVPEAESVIPGGRAHFLFCDGRPLEDVVSTRAIVAAYRAAAGRAAEGVKDVADLARRGDPVAQSVLDDALMSLGRTLRPFVDRFEATAIVVGGSISRAWDVVEPPLYRGLERAGSGPAPVPVLVPETDTDGRALVGAVVATHATSERTGAATGEEGGP